VVAAAGPSPRGRAPGRSVGWREAAPRLGSERMVRAYPMASADAAWLHMDRPSNLMVINPGGGEKASSVTGPRPLGPGRPGVGRRQSSRLAASGGWRDSVPGLFDDVSDTRLGGLTGAVGGPASGECCVSPLATGSGRGRAPRGRRPGARSIGRGGGARRPPTGSRASSPRAGWRRCRTARAGPCRAAGGDPRRRHPCSVRPARPATGGYGPSGRSVDSLVGCRPGRLHRPGGSPSSSRAAGLPGSRL
jgi:hypothetical protein